MNDTYYYVKLEVFNMTFPNCNNDIFVTQCTISIIRIVMSFHLIYLWSGNL